MATYIGRILGRNFGAPRPIVHEPLSWNIELPIEWKEPKFDLAELARLRWIEKWPRKQLARHFGKTEVAIQNHFSALKNKDFRVQGLSESDRLKVKTVVG